ncbi:hypothetical protein ABW19_dt0210527 [Dactylella cylindrospora]|nr:hypothetical protein ABW19_dt0210527 [Dactylella cylindrospora]
MELPSSPFHLANSGPLPFALKSEPVDSPLFTMVAFENRSLRVEVPITQDTPRSKHLTSANTASSSRKRKRPEAQTIPPIPEPFTIAPEAGFGEEVRITPTVFLPRSSINLDWINAKNNARLFRSQIPVLHHTDLILIVKYSNTMQLAAIQRVGTPDNELYALYRLSSAIKLKQVRTIAAQLKKEDNDWIRSDALDGSESDSEEWWNEANLGEEVLRKAFDNSGLKPSEHQLKMTNLLKASKDTDIRKPKTYSKPKAASASTSGQALDDPSCCEQHLLQLKQQYYNLLYASKTSLQYFPKASLSRVRVMFPTGSNSPSSRLDLLLFLEGMIVPVEECDQKHRSGLRQISNARREKLILNDKLSNEDLEAAITPPDCFRDNELRYVLKWLRSFSDDDTVIRSIEQEEACLQKCITELRSRETELQIVLLLEILAIRAKLTEDKLQEYEKLKKAADRRRRRQGKADGKERKKDKKKKKKSTPKNILDLLVDRLCIWHSIGAAHEPKNSQKPDTLDQKAEKDRLKHFCIEIVVAYYSSRIPEVCDEIMRKCTGKLTKAAKKSQKIISQEDQPTQKNLQSTVPEPAKEETPLSTSTARRPPLLSRSLTAPISTPHFERTDSIFSTSFTGDSQDLSFEIAAQVSQEKDILKTSFRAGITNTKKAADRRVVEVPKNRVKRQKSDHSEESQLKDAIKNIAKPNRQAVAEEMVSVSAQRMKTSGRKPKKTIRNPLATTIQVAATPRKNARTAKLLERKAEVPSSIVEEEDAIPSSSQVVPQSSIKQGTKRRSVELDEVEATPSKVPRFDRPRMALHQQDAHRLNFLPSSPSCVASTPLPPKRSLTDSFKLSTTSKPNIFMSQTPTTNPFKSSTEGIPLAKGFMNSISETPTKPSVSSKLRSFLHPDVEEEIIASSPLQRPKPGTPVTRKFVARNLEEDFEDGGPSIYEVLGWE